MRRSLIGLALVPLLAAPAFAAEGAEGGGGLLSINPGLMIWTLLIFFMLLFILTKIAYKPLLAAVKKREQALEEAIEGAKRDREEAQKAMEEQRRLISEARTEAQGYVAQGRATAEKVKQQMLEDARHQQQEMMERAKRDIETEKERAIADLRREAVDIAIAAAEKVIERNLDDDANRKIVEKFLSTLEPVKGAKGARDGKNS